MSFSVGNVCGLPFIS